MIFESHAHYDDEAFDEDRSELLDALPAQGIGRVINVCAEVEGWDRTVDLMERYPYIYGAVGVHPDDVGALEDPADASDLPDGKDGGSRRDRSGLLLG